MLETPILPEPLVGKDFDNTIEVNVFEQVPDKPGLLRVVGRKTWKQLSDECDLCAMSIPALERLVEWHGLPPAITYGGPGEPRPDDEIPEKWRLSVDWKVGGSEGYYVYVVISTPTKSCVIDAARAAAVELGKIRPEFGEDCERTPETLMRESALRNLRSSVEKSNKEHLVSKVVVWQAKFFDYHAAIATSLQLTRALMWEGTCMDDGLRELIGFLSGKINS